MKLLSWNCRCGLSQSKSEAFFSYLKERELEPDLFIIQESNQVDIDHLPYENKTWFGDGKDSKLGISVFSNRYKFERLLEHNINYRYVVPYYIIDKENSDKRFLLFAVWTKEKYCDYPYIGQIYGAINYPTYKELLKTEKNIIIAGDFNANQIWDDENIRKHNPTFMDVKNILEGYGIRSTYHKKFDDEYGKESYKTHFNANTKKFYHIDYCFSSESMEMSEFSVVSYPDEWVANATMKLWKGISDHAPSIVDFKW